MSILDIFSKRQKRLRGELPDVYVYDQIPQPLRIQIIHIWRDAIGDEEQYKNSHKGTFMAYRFIVEQLCREYGVFELYVEKGGYRHFLTELANFLLYEQNTDKILDAVELSFQIINTFTRKYEHLGRHDA